MNPNPTGYPAFQQHPNPMLSAPTGYPVPTQSPNSHQVPFYANAIPAYPQVKTPQSHHPMQQHPQQHLFGAVQLQTSGPGGAIMPSGIPQQTSGPHANFSAPSPYRPSTVPTTLAQSSQPQGVSALPATTAQAPPHNMAALSNPNNMFSGQQRPTQQPNHAAIPAQSAAAQAQAAARDKARVTVLLDINSALLQEVVNLQAAGKAGLPPSQPGPQNSPTQEQSSSSPNPASEQNTNDAPKGQATKPSQEYIDCMRRLQANLAYLATIADKAKKAAGVLPSAPAIMTPPPSLPSLNDMYAKLSELFPGASKPQQQQKHGQQSALHGNGRPSPAPVAETVV